MARRTASGFLFFGAGALLVLVWLLYFLRLHDPAFLPLVYAGWAVLAGGYILIFLSCSTRISGGGLEVRWPLIGGPSRGRYGCWPSCC